MVIIFGGTTGYLGKAFVEELDRRDIKHLSISRTTYNYTSPILLREILGTYRPEFVINAAGFTGSPNVDECESRRRQTLLANVVFPANLAKACDEHGIPFGHVSSGCVYNGTKKGGYTEEDPANFSFTSPPCSFYSGTKALAEEFLIGKCAYIWRMRMPFDHVPHPKNYLTKMLTYEKIYDRTNSLSHRGDCVSACLDLWQRDARYGIYHVTNPGSISAMQACTDLMKAGLRNRYDFFESDEEFMSVAKAPRSSCVLNTDKTAEYVKIRPVEEAMEDCIQRYAHEAKHKAVA